MPVVKSPVVLLSTAICAFALTACTRSPTGHDPQHDLGLLWVKHAAEYQAVAAQVYAQATRDLPGYIDDKTWSAMPGRRGASQLPPAVILDVDETVVSNVDFQLTFERPFANHKLDTWSSSRDSTAVPGVRKFIDAATASGVTLFFVTNRPCQPKDGTNDPCPQKQTTIADIREIGFDVDADFVMLSGERPGWDREKLIRREYIAETYRVIMLIGDDLSDFIPCVRNKIYAPCTEVATASSRAAAVEQYQEYWGAGWYILPNPMHGSWTSTH